MRKILVLFGLAAALILGACEQGQQDQVGQQSGQEPAGEQEQQAMTQEQQTEPQQGAGQEGTPQEQEFYGKSPEFGNAPETITLEAKNGNVTFSHKDHAEMMECQQCHEGTPGKMSGFEKDQAHELCIGCHKEKGAGPAKCQECHKK